MKQRINLRQIEAFRAVMMAGSMTAAAELLSITQPAISRLIRDFEYQTGLVLFERRGNHIIPTQEAASLMQEVGRSFLGLERIVAVARNIARHAAGSLRVAAMPALANGVLPRFAASFIADKPDLYLALIGQTSSLVAEAVTSGQADIGFADGPFDRPGFSVVARPMPALAAIPDDHRLARKQTIEPSDLDGERIIGLEAGTIFALRVSVALTGVQRLTMIETQLSHTALTLVSKGVGIAIIDPSSTLDFIGRGVAIRPLSVFIDAGFVELRRSDRRASAIADKFSAQFWAFHDREVAAMLAKHVA